MDIMAGGVKKVKNKQGKRGYQEGKSGDQLEGGKRFNKGTHRRKKSRWVAFRKVDSDPRGLTSADELVHRSPPWQPSPARTPRGKNSRL